MFAPDMRPPHAGHPWSGYPMTRAMNNVTQVMGEGVPQVLVIPILAQRPEILMSVTSMTVDRVVVAPTHDVATISKPST